MKHYIISVPSAMTPEKFNSLSVAEKKILCAAFKHAHLMLDPKEFKFPRWEETHGKPWYFKDGEEPLKVT